MKDEKMGTRASRSPQRRKRITLEEGSADGKWAGTTASAATARQVLPRLERNKTGNRSPPQVRGREPVREANYERSAEGESSRIKELERTM
jgi:hypothetical protein